MTRWIFITLLFSLLLGTTVSAKVRNAERSKDASRSAPVLANELYAWAQTADFWRLIARGEAIRARLEVRPIKSNVLEAWVCGSSRICVSTKIMQEFAPAERQAVIAHEVGHLLIPRNYGAHPQLWEVQCDLFAAVLLRDAGAVRQMLHTLAQDCRTCRDALHPAPAERLALLDRFAVSAVAQGRKLDGLRAHNFAVVFRGRAAAQPLARKTALRSLHFPITLAAGFSNLQALNFVINFEKAALRWKRVNKTP